MYESAFWNHWSLLMKSNVYRSEGVRGEWNLGKLVLVCKRQGHHSRALRSYFRLGKDLRRSLPADDVHTTTRWPQLRSDETCVALDECLAVDNRQKVLPSSQPPHEKKGPAEAIAHEVIVVVTNPCRSPRHLAKYFSLVSAKIARWRHEGETPLLCCHRKPRSLNDDILTLTFLIRGNRHDVEVVRVMCENTQINKKNHLTAPSYIITLLKLNKKDNAHTLNFFL